MPPFPRFRRHFRDSLILARLHARIFSNFFLSNNGPIQSEHRHALGAFAKGTSGNRRRESVDENDPAFLLFLCFGSFRGKAAKTGSIDWSKARFRFIVRSGRV